MAQLAMPLAPDETVPVVRERRRPRLRLVYSRPKQLELWGAQPRRLPLYRASCRELGNPDDPCPFASCRHHLYSDPVRWPEFEAMLAKPRHRRRWGFTCSLVVADAVGRSVPGSRPDGVGRVLRRPGAQEIDGTLALSDVGRHLGCSGERARQIEAEGMRHVGDAAEIVDAFEEIDWDGDHDPGKTPRRGALIRAHRFGEPIAEGASLDAQTDAARVGQVRESSGAPFGGFSW